MEASTSTQPNTSADLLADDLKIKLSSETPYKLRMPLPDHIRELITEKRYWNRQYQKWPDAINKKLRNEYNKKVKIEVQKFRELMQIPETHIDANQTSEAHSISAIQLPEDVSALTPSLNRHQTFPELWKAKIQRVQQICELMQILKTYFDANQTSEGHPIPAIQFPEGADALKSTLSHHQTISELRKAKIKVQKMKELMQILETHFDANQRSEAHPIPAIQLPEGAGALIPSLTHRQTTPELREAKIEVQKICKLMQILKTYFDANQTSEAHSIPDNQLPEDASALIPTHNHDQLISELRKAKIEVKKYTELMQILKTYFDAKQTSEADLIPAMQLSEGASAINNL